MLMNGIATTVNSSRDLPKDGFNKRLGRSVKPNEIWYTHQSKSTHKWDGKAWIDQGTCAHPRPSDGKLVWVWP